MGIVLRTMFLLWLAVTGALSANEPQESAANLPSDGAWVRYKVVLEAEEEGIRGFVRFKPLPS